MTAKIKLVPEIQYIDQNLLAAKAGGSSVWRELIEDETYIIVEGCTQTALDAALVNTVVVADAEARETKIKRDGILAALVASDEGMVRTIEDNWSLLMVKGLIAKTDIPQIVLDKIATRKTLREQLALL